MFSPIGIDPLQPQGESAWRITFDGAEIQRLRPKHPEVEEGEWDEVVTTAANVLGNCPRPNGPPTRRTGLALGKIQSGKTLSYTALIALAVDNRYRIMVVLAGTKNPLLEQIHSRLKDDLAGPTVTPFKNPTVQQDSSVIESILHGDGHVLIVVLKSRKRIAEVRNLLSAPEIHGYPALIIDDEGDEASLNTQFRRGRRSAIYTSILALRDALQVHAYVAYTATPQANLLIDGIDGLSPDFGVLVRPGKGYCGGSVFFGPNRGHYVRELSAGENERDNSTPIPDGLKLAIATFLVGGTIRHQRDPNAWNSMLIHNSNLKADHDQLQVDVRRLIGLWREKLALPAVDPGRTELLRTFRQAYDDLCTTVSDPPSWDDVSARLHDDIWQVEVWMVNSMPQGRDPIGTPLRVRNNVMIGGNMLGRGLTIPDLSITYITRRAQQETNADTMEQRARWFGYKQAYLDLCRIFLTPQLRADYTELLRHEDDFWASLERTQRLGLPIREWPRMFSLDSEIGLRPTRGMVANYRQFGGPGWTVQTQVIEDEAVAASNVLGVREFLARHPGEARRWGTVTHSVIEACPTDAVVSELLARIQTGGTNWDGPYMKEYLERLFVRNDLPTINVVFMSGGQARLRTKEANGHINPMQGSNREPPDPDYYPGDRDFHDNSAQLQVHVIRLEGTNLARPVETTAFALYAPPNDPRFRAFVVRSEINPGEMDAGS